MSAANLSAEAIIRRAFPLEPTAKITAYMLAAHHSVPLACVAKNSLELDLLRAQHTGAGLAGRYALTERGQA